MSVSDTGESTIPEDEVLAEIKAVLETSTVLGISGKDYSNLTEEAQKMLRTIAIKRIEDRSIGLPFAKLKPKERRYAIEQFHNKELEAYEATGNYTPETAKAEAYMRWLRRHDEERGGIDTLKDKMSDLLALAAFMSPRIKEINEHYSGWEAVRMIAEELQALCEQWVNEKYIGLGYTLGLRDAGHCPATACIEAGECLAPPEEEVDD